MTAEIITGIFWLIGGLFVSIGIGLYNHCMWEFFVFYGIIIMIYSFGLLTISKIK